MLDLLTHWSQGDICRIAQLGESEMPSRFAIEGNCKKCGSTAFTAPDNATNGAWITCDGCGQRFMTWKAFKAGAIEVASANFIKRNVK